MLVLNILTAEGRFLKITCFVQQPLLSMEENCFIGFYKWHLGCYSLFIIKLVFCS